MNYYKEATRRGLIGLLMALFASYTTLMIVSIGQASLTLDTSVFLQQYFIYAISGFYFAGISILFSIDEWSLLRQFITHVICTLPFLPIAHFIGFMPSHTWGRLLFIGFYLSGYVISFVIYKVYLIKQTQAINASL